MDVMLQGIVGSTAYGLAHADSDEDRLGIFVRPTTEVLGLWYNSQNDSVVVHDPEDSQHHEIGKYLRLILGANPTALELLYLAQYDIQTPEGAELLAIRDSFLSQKVRATYGGYAIQQVKKLQARDGESFSAGGKSRRAKHARHCFRLLQQGTRLLETGTLTLLVENRDEIFGIGDLPTQELVERFETEFARFNEMDTALPEEPDTALALDFLLRVRKNHW